MQKVNIPLSQPLSIDRVEVVQSSSKILTSLSEDTDPTLLSLRLSFHTSTSAYELLNNARLTAARLTALENVGCVSLLGSRSQTPFVALPIVPCHSLNYPKPSITTPRISPTSPSLVPQAPQGHALWT